jgi:hypothetical protein
MTFSDRVNRQGQHELVLGGEREGIVHYPTDEDRRTAAAAADILDVEIEGTIRHVDRAAAEDWVRGHHRQLDEGMTAEHLGRVIATIARPPVYESPSDALGAAQQEFTLSDVVASHVDRVLQLDDTDEQDWILEEVCLWLMDEGKLDEADRYSTAISELDHRAAMEYLLDRRDDTLSADPSVLTDMVHQVVGGSNAYQELPSFSVLTARRGGQTVEEAARSCPHSIARGGAPGGTFHSIFR